MKTFLALALLLVGTAQPAFAQTAASQPRAAKSTSADKLDKIVCQTEESLGSRLNVKRVCKTVREWREEAEGSREALERIQQGQGTVPSG